MKEKILTLYPEDFRKLHDWIAVCQQLEINPDSTSSVDIFFNKVEADSFDADIEEDEEDVD